MGEELPELGYLTVCNKFQPTIIEGQHCFTLDTAQLRTGKNKTKFGKSNGLFILIDQKPYSFSSIETKERGPKKEDRSFMVYIHTLSHYTTYGSGSYAMNTLKKMTVTESFKHLQQHQRKCLVHNREDCETQKFFDQVLENCHCHPWVLKTNQVKVFILGITKIFLG